MQHFGSTWTVNNDGTRSIKLSEANKESLHETWYLPCKEKEQIVEEEDFMMNQCRGYKRQRGQMKRFLQAKKTETIRNQMHNDFAEGKQRQKEKRRRMKERKPRNPRGSSKEIETIKI